MKVLKSYRLTPGTIEQIKKVCKEERISAGVLIELALKYFADKLAKDKIKY
jgi:hypothetical protein